MSNSDRRIIFFDIDGTLITDDDEHLFPQDAIDAIRAARAAGHLTFINTGRSYCNIESWIKAAGFDGYVCGCGSHIMYQGKELYHKVQPQETCREIAYKCREYGINSIFEYKDWNCYDHEMTLPDMDNLLEYFGRDGKKVISDIEDKDFIFDKFSGWYDENSDVEGFIKYISQYFDYIDREGNFCEVEPKGHSKASGIKFILDYLGLPLHNAVVFGDGNNDLEMLRLVPNSVCMGQGSELAQKTASYITDTVREGGIANALRYFGVIQGQC